MQLFSQNYISQLLKYDNERFTICTIKAASKAKSSRRVEYF